MKRFIDVQTYQTKSNVKAPFYFLMFRHISLFWVVFWGLQWRSLITFCVFPKAFIQFYVMNLNTSGQVLFRKIPPQEAARPSSGAVFAQAQSLLRHVFVLFDVTSTFLYWQTFHLQNIPSEFTKEFRKVHPLFLQTADANVCKCSLTFVQVLMS